MKKLTDREIPLNQTHRNKQSIQDFIEKFDSVNINIINSPKIPQEMDKTHQSILNPFTRRKIVNKKN